MHLRSDMIINNNLEPVTRTGMDINELKASSNAAVGEFKAFIV